MKSKEFSTFADGSDCKECAALERKVNRITARLAAAEAELDNYDICEWEYDDTHDKWDTYCGNAWQLSNDGSIAENGMNFCPFCGGVIRGAAKAGGGE